MIELLLPTPTRQAQPSHGIDLSPGADFWFTDVLGWRGTSAAVPVSEQTAMTYSAVWAATRLLCGTGGWLPLDLFKRLPKGGREVVWDDPRETLVHDRPNREMPSMMFRATGIAQQVNAGNCYAEIERDRKGFPIATWPIHHTRVRVKRDEDGALVYLVHNNDGTAVEFPAADILHVPSMMSDDGIVGKGVIRHAMETIGFGLAMEKQGAGFFGDNALPRVIVKHPGMLDEQARNAFRKEWKGIYGGPHGDKVALLGAGGEIEALNLNYQELQFLEGRQHGIEEIARWYGIPPHMLQHLLRATFNNVEELGINFVVYSLIPWLKLWEQELWAKLLTLEEQATMFFEFNVNALMRGNAAARSAFYQIMVFSGLMSPNEARGFENLNPYDGGDQFVMQSAMVPVDMLGAAAQAAIQKANQPAEKPGGENGNGEKPPEDKSALLLRAIVHQTHGIESRIANATAGLVNEARKEFLAKLDGIQFVMPPATDSREPALIQAASEMLKGSIRRMLKKEGTACRRAAKAGGNFLAWLDGFYSPEYVSEYQSEVQASCEALRWLGVDVSAEGLADSQVQASRDELLALSECKAAELAGKVDQCATGWESGRAASVVEAVVTKREVAA